MEWAFQAAHKVAETAACSRVSESASCCCRAATIGAVKLEFFPNLLGFDQSLADGVANQFAPVVQIELAHKIALVGIHRLNA